MKTFFKVFFMSGVITAYVSNIWGEIILPGAALVHWFVVAGALFTPLFSLLTAIEVAFRD